MNSQQSAPVLEEILRALGDKVGNVVTADALGEELQRYLDYGVPPDQARTAILRHYGAPPPQEGAGARRPLVEVQANEPFVNLHVRVVAVNEKEVLVRGEKRRIQYGLLGDESMTRPFTAWKTLEAQKGDVLRITGAYTRPYQGSVEIQLGDRALIEPADPDSLPATSTPRPVNVGELAAGMSNVDLTARLLSIAPRTLQVQGQPKTVWSGLLADATGKAGFTSWFDFGLREGQAVRVRGGYVRAFRGAPQFTFDEKAEVEVLADDALPTRAELDRAGPTPLADLYLGSGAVDVTVEATLVEIRPGSGLVTRCPQCNRVLRPEGCRVHGKSEGRPDLRIKGVLDDGTAALGAVFGREVTEALLGRTLAEIQESARDPAAADPGLAELRAKLLARPLRVRGNVLVDEFGPTLLVQDASRIERDLAAAAEALLAELEGAV